MTPSTVLDELDPSALDRLLHAYGIASEFIEFSGNIKQIPLADRYRTLAAMGRAPSGSGELEYSLRQQEIRHVFALPAVMSVLSEAPGIQLWFPMRQAETATCRWQLACENGQVLEGEGSPDSWPLVETDTFDASEWEARLLSLPPLPFGYHRLVISQGERQWQTLLVVAPQRAWQPEKLAAGKKVWGLSMQLYTMGSHLDCGIGDFAILMNGVEQAAAAGADFLLLNPLHALDIRYPENASPYSPSDRRFLNPLYIALPLVPGFGLKVFQERWLREDTQGQLQQVRTATHVRYTEVSDLKYSLLEQLYGLFQSGDPEALREFAAWRVAAGEPLLQFTSFQASFAPAGSIAANEDYHAWLQWLAQAQLQACQDRALELGMSIGLVRDLAVGSSVDGCEVLSNLDQYCLDARIGAPPDNFNPDGQNWGLPPLLPHSLEAQEFRIFRELLRSNMQACGALRIDHVLGLCRLWWCPNDGSNSTGAYVHYPVDLLFAIVRLESWRQQCVVIGEDLGVVPPTIRTYLDEGGIYSNCVFYFEKYDNWHFRKPADYKWQALTMQANHDVAPLTSWWKGSDLELRHGLGLIADADQLQRELDWRRGERGQLLQWLDEQGLLPAEWSSRPLDAPLDEPLQLALTTAIGRVTSQLVSVQLDDLIGMEQPVNIPGTSSEYANWRRKLPITIDAIFARPAVQSLLKALRDARSE